jgi:hypothetical protein
MHGQRGNAPNGNSRGHVPEREVKHSDILGPSKKEIVRELAWLYLDRGQTRGKERESLPELLSRGGGTRLWISDTSVNGGFIGRGVAKNAGHAK